MSDKLKLSKLHLTNFKNIQIQNNGLEQHGLNVWIGPNGSGKSNLIRVLKFLREAAAETKDSQGITAFEQSAIELGDQNISDRTIKKPSTVAFDFFFNKTSSCPHGLHLHLELLIKETGAPIVKKEMFCEASPHYSDMDEPFFFYKSHDFESGKAVVSVYSGDSKGKTKFERLNDVPVNRLTLSAIPQLLEDSQFSPESTPIYKVRRRLIETISDWRFYNANEMNLKEIRESEPKIGPMDEFISSSGQNLAIVFDNLNQKDIDFEDKINTCMKSVLPTTKRIRSVRSGRLRLTIEWYHNEANEPFYLNEMSDGTVRMLCWAVILNSPVLPSLLVIDEPELGLHPAWLNTLAKWIKAASAETQVIITTHSPDLLDHFSDRVNDVVCFHYDGKNHFKPTRLSEKALKPKLEDGWELGDLYRIGDPDIGGWPW